MINGASSLAASAIGDLTALTSAVTNKTNPIPIPTSTYKSGSGGFRGGGGGGHSARAPVPVPDAPALALAAAANLNRGYVHGVLGKKPLAPAQPGLYQFEITEIKNRIRGLHIRLDETAAAFWW
jgi:hypothetical protein